MFCTWPPMQNAFGQRQMHKSGSSIIGGRHGGSKGGHWQKHVSGSKTIPISSQPMSGHSHMDVSGLKITNGNMQSSGSCGS